MKRLLVFLPLVALVLAALLFGVFALNRGTTRVEPNAMLGKPAPAVAAPYLEGGGPVQINDEIKGPALVNLFASWCAPCIVENPYLLQLQERGARIIGIAQKDEPADTAQFLARWGDPFTLVFDDRPGRATIEYGATGLPETFVVNSEGMIVYKHVGPIENQQEADALLRALQQAS